MTKTSCYKVRASIKKDFPSDPMMQVIHEHRARNPIKTRDDVLRMHRSLKKNLASQGMILKQVSPGQFRIIQDK